MTLAAGSIIMKSNNLKKFEMGDTGAFLYGAAEDDYVNVKSDGVDIVASNTDRASFGATTTIGNTSTEHVEVTSTSLKLLDGSTERVVVDSGSATIGQVSSNKTNVRITDSGVFLRNNTTPIISISGTEVVVSGSILEKTRLFGSGEDLDISLQDGGNSGTTNQESSYGVTGGHGSRIMLRGNGSNNDLHDAPNNGTADWHLEQDVYCRNLTLASPVILWTDGFRLFVKDTLTIASGATIANDGRPGSGTTGGEGGGGVAGATGTLSAGTSGTAGGEGGGASPGGGQDGGDGGGGGGSGGFVFISARVIANSGVIRSHGGTGGQGAGTD